MGKVAAAAAETMAMKKKKKGRPSLSDLQKRNLKPPPQPQTPDFNSPNRRSTRRNPHLNGISPSPEWISGDGDDDDDEREKKKVKLVVRLPPSNSLSLNSASDGSDSNANGDNKPKINAAGDGSGDLSAVPDQVEKVQKATDTLHGSPLESGPTTPLPDKKLLMFILERLQKKDTYGVFSEPVDPNELPDYHEIIEHPMDFGTVRKKLDEGRYSDLDKFEADVFLICSNAMEYNAPDTIYFRQARTIEELAKRDFQNLRQVNDDGEPQPKIVRRGRPPGKNLKKSLGSPPFERVGPESSSDATLATGGDNAIGSSSYNLRRVPISSFRFRPNDEFSRASHESRNSETYADWLSEWNSEFPASILKAEAKCGKKQFSFDENRRATYKQLHPTAFHEPYALATLNGNMKQLMGVGLHSEHGYERSLARFAANLGPVVWKIASNKIERVLPAGVKFGPGWVGENEASPRPPSALPEQKPSNNLVHDGPPLGPVITSLSGINSVGTYRSSLPSKEDMVEAVGGQNSNSELAVLKGGVGGISPGPSFQTQQKNILYPNRNGFNGVSGYDLSSQMGMLRGRRVMPTEQSGLEEASVPSQMLGVVSRSNTLLTPPMVPNHIISESKLAGSLRSKHYENISVPGTTPDSHAAPEVAVCGVQPWQGLPSYHKQHSLPAPPDLNVRVQAPGSPSSSFRIGSPQQPDLALQL